MFERLEAYGIKGKSGYFGHAGRPGHKGGSSPSGATKQPVVREVAVHPQIQFGEFSEEDVVRSLVSVVDALKDLPGAVKNAVLKVSPEETFLQRAKDKFKIAVKKLAEIHNLSVSDYIKAATENLKQLFAKQSVSIRVPDEYTLQSILRDGRFKSQHETQTTQGSFAPAMRRQAENHMFSYPEGLPEALRPIYGYIGPPYGQDTEIGSVGSYGEISLKLRDSVKERTTWTPTDSLYESANMEDNAWIASPVTNPSIYGTIVTDTYGSKSSRAMTDPLLATSLVGLKDYASSYVEAQIHGQLHVDDIEHVYFLNRNPSPEMRHALDSRGIKWTMVDERYDYTSGGRVTSFKLQPGQPAKSLNFYVKKTGKKFVIYDPYGNEFSGLAYPSKKMAEGRALELTSKWRRGEYPGYGRG